MGPAEIVVEEPQRPGALMVLPLFAKCIGQPRRPPDANSEAEILSSRQNWLKPASISGRPHISRLRMPVISAGL